MKLERLQELSDRYFRDELTPLERIELIKIVENPDDSCKAFMDELYDTGLFVMVGKNIALQPRFKEIKPQPYKLIAKALAALILIGTFSLFFLPESKTPEVTERRPLIAKLTTISSKSDSQKKLDLWVRAGSYSIPAGKHQLAFTNGNKVNIWGEAKIDLVDEKKMHLHKGNIIAKVSKEAKTFTVITPSASIVDLGTIFHVKVNELMNSNIYVKQGRVQVTSIPHGGSKVLSKKESIRVLHNGNFQNIDKQKEIFNLDEDSPGPLNNRKDLAWMHWDFERDLTALDQTIQPNTSSELIPKFGNLSMPKVCESPFGKGIRFDGIDDGLKAKYRGIGGNDARTISLWVRLNPNQAKKGKNAFVYWGNHHVDGRKWQVCTNVRKDQGLPQTLRVELRQGYLVGSTPIDDGRWHHVAVVFIGGYTSDVATHVMLYLDGALEKISDYSSKVVDTDISSKDSDPLHVGLYHGEKLSTLQGDIDELWIFDQALMSEEIIRLRDFNTPFDHNLN